jgi:muramoyltetrapeptide carboxypeptidase
MITPPYLKKGDKVAIIAPVRKVSESEITPAIEILNQYFDVVLSPNLFAEHHQFGGTDTQRIMDLQWAINQKEIKAIFIARGGYGLIRIIDQIDFKPFVKSPKWIVGYSDVTVLHAHINTCFNVCTLHATMPFQFLQSTDATMATIDTLMGEPLAYQYNASFKCINGKTKGLLVGGNLSLIHALSGSVSDLNTNKKLLFLEDLDEYLYHIDRMMFHLQRSQKLKNLNALIVGGMTDMKDNAIPFGYDAHEIIYNICKLYQFPVAFDFPAGHIQHNMPLILGKMYTLEIQQNQVKLSSN